MSEILKKLSDFLARYKGLPVLLGIGMVLLNLIFNLMPPWPVIYWLAHTDLFLHLGIVIGLFGILLGDAL